jgi:hypothetical protein
VRIITILVYTEALRKEPIKGRKSSSWILTNQYYTVTQKEKGKESHI